ncbi:MAG: helix-turn-helix domain-containing protein [Flavonifractor plautii]
MEFRERLYQLRKGRGISQEELAHTVGVSRQAVQKWEAGAATPDLGNLSALADYFVVSLDYLVRGIEPEKPAAPSPQQAVIQNYYRGWRYEYRSRRTLFGLPLVHINLCDRSLCRAKGVIAIGNVATGLIAIGGFSAGLLTLGGFSAGLLALGGLAAGGSPRRPLRGPAGCLGRGGIQPRNCLRRRRCQRLWPWAGRRWGSTPPGALRSAPPSLSDGTHIPLPPVWLSPWSSFTATPPRSCSR